MKRLSSVSKQRSWEEFLKAEVLPWSGLFEALLGKKSHLRSPAWSCFSGHLLSSAVGQQRCGEVVCKLPSEPAWATAFRADCIPLLGLGLLLALAGCASDLDLVLNTPVCQTSSISPTMPEHPMKCFLVFFKLLAHVAEGI